jgi:glc operon protein GlcG
MHRLIALAGAACVATLISTGAFAQVTPNPDNPNDAIPDALTPPPYGEPINLETAKKVAAAAIMETTKRNWNAFCVSVVNPSGDLVYFEKQDNCQYASIGISQHKARTAARYRRPTLVLNGRRSRRSALGPRLIAQPSVLSGLVGRCTQSIKSRSAGAFPGAQSR